MVSPDDTSGRTLDVNQIQWALRHGQKIDGLENIMLSNQSVMSPDNHIDNSMRENSPAQNSSLHNTASEAQNNKLWQSLQREILLLKNEFANIAQGAAIEEQINKFNQTLNQEILSLKSEMAAIAQGTAFEEQMGKIGKYMNQEILSLRNEFAVFVQTQLNQEKAKKITEFEWENSLKDHNMKIQIDMREIQQNIMGKINEHLQCVDEQLQHNYEELGQEVALVTSQLATLQEIQESEEKIFITEFREKIEENQMRLMEKVGYIQYVIEEIATRPHSTEAQQKLRENFFIREIGALREEMVAMCLKCNSTESDCALTNVQQCDNKVAQPEIDSGSEIVLPSTPLAGLKVQEEINLDSEGDTQEYKQKRRRR